MANQAFMKRIKNAGLSQGISPVITPDLDEFDEDLLNEENNNGESSKIEDLLNDSIEEGNDFISENTESTEEIIENKIQDEISKNSVVDLDNIPSIPSLNIDNEDNFILPEIPEVKEEPKRRKPGRPKVNITEEEDKIENDNIQQDQILNEDLKQDIEISKAQDETSIETCYNNSNVQNFNIENDNNMVAQKILNYVCLKTIESLKDSYKSEIYTEKFTRDMFEKYLKGEINSSDPLFRGLISECISCEVKDKYLDNLTIDVLKYIMEG